MASSDVVFTFGQFKGQPIAQVLTGAPWYVRWAYESILQDVPWSVAHGGVTPEQYAEAVARDDETKELRKAQRLARRQEKAVEQRERRESLKPRPKRFGAFLRRYGPRGGLPTHFKLVLAHAPRPNTPEAFLLELDEEQKADSHGLKTHWQLHLGEQAAR